ncbi:MAG: ATP-dependent DNA ligase [Candidatus Heimdallarchaeaceae archaeon]
MENLNLVENKRPKRTGIMLAVPADERKVKNLGDWFYIQPKLNGERCRVIDFHGEPIFLSSECNSYEFLDHLKVEVKRIWREYGANLPFDGEVYVHGWSREEINSTLSRKVNISTRVKELQLHVFDLDIPFPQGERVEIYQDALLRIKSSVIIPVPTYKADIHSWQTFSDYFLSQGYEGAILRKWNHPIYEPRRLTGQMLKYKPTEFDEYIILEVLEAISKEGEPKSEVGAFLVQGNDLSSFKVGAGKLKQQQRKYYWLVKDSLPGKILKVKQGKILTTKGFPTCAVAVEIL